MKLQEIKSYGVALLTKAPQNKLKVKSSPSKRNSNLKFQCAVSVRLHGSVHSFSLHHHRDLLAETREEASSAQPVRAGSLEGGKVLRSDCVFIPTKSPIGSLAAAK